MKKIIYVLGGLFIVILFIAGYFLNAALPIGSGYSSKYICSQVFLADRDSETVFEQDVKPTNPLFSTISNHVDYDEKTVASSGFGFWQPRTAVYREGFGCTVAIGVTRQELLEQAKGAIPQPEPDMEKTWPQGEKVDLSDTPPEVNMEKLNRIVQEAFVEPGPETQRNTQAVVIVYKGKLIAEKYAEGFNETSPMLGWSMSKSVTNALVGILVRENRLNIFEPAPVDRWQGPDDPRRKITLDQMLRMSSGLEFEEIYEPFRDVTYMLYDSKSMADYAAEKPLRSNPDEEWYYSSGTTNIIARIVRDEVGGSLVEFNNFARTRLFDKIGMYSAIIEPDASGSFVGSSYMFATPRDWARFGLLLLNDGVWENERILPENWVNYSTTPTPESNKGRYGAHFWLNAGDKSNPENRHFPSLPRDLFYLSGFNHQIVAVIPSRSLIVVRLGVTHDKSWDAESFIYDIMQSINISA